MAERTSRREEEKDVDPKSELGGNDDTEWLKDPKAELGGGNDSDWLKDPAPIDAGPIVRDDGAPTDDWAGVEPPFADDPTEDADWADDDAEMEVDVETFEEVDIDDEEMER